MKKIDKNLFSAILYIVIGVLLIIFKSETIGWAMTIAGILFVVSGILDIIKKNYTGGGISLAIGLAILILGWVAAKIVLLLMLSRRRSSTLLKSFSRFSLSLPVLCLHLVTVSTLYLSSQVSFLQLMVLSDFSQHLKSNL